MHTITPEPVNSNVNELGESPRPKGWEARAAKLIVRAKYDSPHAYSQHSRWKKECVILEIKSPQEIQSDLSATSVALHMHAPVFGEKKTFRELSLGTVRPAKNGGQS